MTENIETNIPPEAFDGSSQPTAEETKGQKRTFERVPLREKTDRSLRSITKSLIVLGEALGKRMEPAAVISEDMTKEARETAIAHAMGIKRCEGNAVFDTGPALNAVVLALNDLVAMVEAIAPSEVTDFRGGGALSLKPGDVVVGAKLASAKVKALLGTGLEVEALDEDLGTVKVSGIDAPLPRNFVARRDLAGRMGRKAATPSN